MDLSTLAQSETAELHLRNPKDGSGIFHSKGKPVTITIASPDSPKFVSARRARVNKRINEVTAGAVAVLSAEEQDADLVQVLAWATVDWNLEVDGKKPECTEQNAIKLYCDPRFGWLRAQVNTFMNDRANFVLASKQNF